MEKSEELINLEKKIFSIEEKDETLQEDIFLNGHLIPQGTTVTQEKK